MRSSTSPSESRVPWHAARLLAVAAITWLLGAVYTLAVNPEVRFFRHGAKVKQAWVRNLSPSGGSGRILVYGGSSCTVTVDGERMLEGHGLAVANLGLGAGIGARVLTEFARTEVRPGDTLIVALEPRLLTEPVGITALGIQFSWALWDPALMALSVRETPSVTGISALLSLRPGGYHVFTLLGKLASGQPLYRYATSEFKASGWQAVTVRREVHGPPERGPGLSKDASALLAELRSWCAQRNIRIAYALPWGYCPQDQAESFQRANAAFLAEIEAVLPVLRDERMGVYGVRTDFADTYWHLTPEGARKRTDELAGQIKAWVMWTSDELKQRAGADPAGR